MLRAPSNAQVLKIVPEDGTLASYLLKLIGTLKFRCGAVTLLGKGGKGAARSTMFKAARSRMDDPELRTTLRLISLPDDDTLKLTTTDPDGAPAGKYLRAKRREVTPDM